MDKKLEISDPKLMELYNNLTECNKIFERQNVIGHGTFGHVYQGVHVVTKTLVAIKVLEVGKHRLEKQIREIQLMKECNHQNVCQFYCAFLETYSETQCREIWIIMEVCTGGSLKNLIEYFKRRQEYIPNDIFMYVSKNILEGLKYLHYKGIIHRDIKSPNILFDWQATIKLIDLGVSKKLPDNEERTRTVMGTPY